jgi:hypothetical protein
MRRAAHFLGANNHVQWTLIRSPQRPAMTTTTAILLFSLAWIMLGWLWSHVGSDLAMDESPPNVTGA